MINAATMRPMSYPSNRILCVDDDEIICEMLTHLLGDVYEVLTVFSGEECLNVVNEFNPDVILMDVQMQGISGYETCERLKQSYKTNDIPVIFVSALISSEERLGGYNAGGDDYVTKPFNDEELQHKIRHTFQNLKRLKHLKSSTRKALTASEENALVSRFMRKTFSCHSHGELAAQVLEVLTEYHFDGSIQFCVDREPSYWSTHNEIGELEQAALDYILTHGTLKTSNLRFMTSMGNVAILISNMPADDPVRHARLEENLCLITESADARLNFLATQKYLEMQRSALRLAENKTISALAGIDRTYTTHQKNSRIILSSLADEIEASYDTIAISEEHEEFLRELIATADEKISSLFEDGLQLDHQFNSIIGDIRQTLGTKSG